MKIRIFSNQLKKQAFIILISFLIGFSNNIYSQNVAVTDNEIYSANASAMLDVYSTTKGMLIPRLTTMAKDTMHTPATGLIVYDTGYNSFYYYNGTGWVKIPQINSAGSTGSALFAVVNATGDTIFAVYNDGVKVTVPEGSKGSVGGFAVSGRTMTKAGIETDYFRVTSDSTRIYINDTSTTKGNVGGFAVSGRTVTKAGEPDYLRVTPDSTRVYVNEGTTKGNVGGFAVSGRTLTKSIIKDYFLSTPDSTRIYVNDTSLTKGSVGGFAVSGRTQTKSNPIKFMDMTPKNYLVGQLAGESLNTGKFNMFFGYQSGRYYTSGSYNTFLGYQAGLSSSTIHGTGINNVAIGYQAGSNLTTGRDNVFIGTQAGDSATTAYENTIIGYLAGKDLTTGHRNIAIGFNAGKGLTTNNRNVLIGEFAGYSLAQGLANVFLGTYSGYLKTSGNNNTFLGYDTGFENYSGSGNTYIGFWSGRWAKGDSCVFIGSNAGAVESASHKLYIDNTSTSTPLIWGDFNLDYATIHGKLGVYTKSPAYTIEGWGTNAALIAHYSGQSRGGISALSGTRIALLSTASTDDLVFGYTSDVDQLDFSTAFVERMRIDNGTGNIGIGTTSPSYKLDIAGTLRSTQTTYLATSSGYNVGIGTTTPSEKLHVKGSTATNAQIYIEAGEWNSIGDYTQVNLGDGNHYIRGEYANGLIFYTIDERGFSFGGGNVRIGTSLNYAPLNVEKWEGLVAMFNRRNTTGQIIQFRYTNTEIGNISTNGSSTSYNTTSDKRLKENIVDTKYGLNDLLKINVHDFNFINDPKKIKLNGFIAQELFEIYPDAVTLPETQDSPWQVDYGKITPLLVKSIQDQQKIIQNQQSEIDLLKSKIEQIEKLLEKE